MDSALIVTYYEKEKIIFEDLLHAASVNYIEHSKSCGEARRMLLERDFDLVLINAPLKDETGENLSRHIAVKGTAQAVLVVASEYFDAVSAKCEDDGVLTISKPIEKTMFWAVVKLACAAQSRVSRMQDENKKLKQKIEDIRRIDRAKSVLISHSDMSEQEAHRYIEKQSMDLRVSRREIAEMILKPYNI